MKVKPIRSDSDYQATLRRIEELWGSPVGSSGGDELEVLVTLVEAFEREHYPVDLPDPVEAIRFRLEQNGSDIRALIGVIGQRTRVYEVMRRDRPLSLAMIRRLHDKLGIPAEVLIYAGRRAHRKRSAAKTAKPSRQSA